MSYFGYTTCPQCCCSMAIEDEFGSRQITQCPMCGFREELRNISKTEGEEMKTDGWEISDYGSDTRLHAKKTFVGVGTIRFSNKNGMARTSSFNAPITEAVAAETAKGFDDPTLIKKKCYITRWNEQKKQLEVLFGSICGPACILREGECDACVCRADLSIKIADES